MEDREFGISEETGETKESIKLPGNMQHYCGERSPKEPLWIFGYGSLCWNPGFEYLQCVTGFVRGFSRRFWQGNITHRGTEEKPGRVATLIEDKDGVTWGKAFLVSAEDKVAIPYLTGRECHLGGYKTCTVSFHPKSCTADITSVVLYVAVPENKYWLGSAPLPDIARQILECHGPSGSNAEYLLKLARFMRDELPEELDEHLFSLERLVRKFAGEMRLCLRSLMGERESPKPELRSDHYASRIPEKKLRCVNM